MKANMAAVRVITTASLLNPNRFCCIECRNFEISRKRDRQQIGAEIKSNFVGAVGCFLD